MIAQLVIPKQIYLSLENQNRLIPTITVQKCLDHPILSCQESHHQSQCQHTNQFLQGTIDYGRLRDQTNSCHPQVIMTLGQPILC
jgi:hypothetical protein